MTEGNNIPDADSILEDALVSWLEIVLEKNIDISEPTQADLNKYSGKLLLRMPKSLHKALLERSEAENASLNSVVNMLLTKSLAS
jgi:antitoxin HicB